MSHRRRDLLKCSGLWAALGGSGLLIAGRAGAQELDAAFSAVSMQEALRALGGVPALGDEIVLSLPDIAENGAVVPVSVECRLPGTKEIYLVVESNPNPLVVRFDIPQGTEPYIATRIKMAESSDVYAVVRADGGLYSARKKTTVMVGGCD